MTATALDRTDRQRLEALELANAARSQKAIIKQQLKHGEIDPQGVFADPPASMVVMEFLLSLPRVGEIKAENLCARIHVPHDARLVELSERQTIGLEEFLTERFGQPRRCKCGNKLSVNNYSGTCQSCKNVDAARRKLLVVKMGEAGRPRPEIVKTVGLSPQRVNEILLEAA